MKTMKCAWGLWVALFMLFSAMPMAYADFYWEQEEDGAGIVKFYLAPDAFRMERGEMILISDFKANADYLLNPGSKTYSKSDLVKKEKGQKPTKDAAMLDKFRQMMKMKITPTNETGTVAGYNCKKYLMASGIIKSEIWVTKELDGYKEFKEIIEKQMKIRSKDPMLKQFDIGNMVTEMDGFPVQSKTETDLGPMTAMLLGDKMPKKGKAAMPKKASTTMLKKFEKKTLNKEMFKVPKGYKQTKGIGQMMPGFMK